MRGVLFLTETFHPVLGGGETHIRGLGGWLGRAGVPTTVVTRRTDAILPERERFEDMEVVRVGPSGAGSRKKFGMIAPALRALRRERSRFDVVVVRGTRVLGVPGLVAARALGRGVVLQPEVNGEFSGEVYTWGKAWARGPVGAAARWVTRVRNLWMRDADACVAMSRQIAAEMAQAGIAKEKIHLIPHGVDRNRFRPADAEEKRRLRAALGIDDASTVVAFTGRLLRGKGVEFLLRAFDGIAARHPSAVLLIAGSGEAQALSVEGVLKSEAASLASASRIRFLGRVDAVEDVLRAADVFAFPSEFEGLGLSLVEAAACGVPAVGSRTGGIVDVIEDGASGWLVAPRDVPALQAALEALVADEETRRRFGRRGVDIVRQRFDAEGAAERYRALFAEIADRSRDRGAPRMRVAAV